MPNINPESTTMSLTTTITTTTKVTSSVSCFRKKPPPPLPPRQMSLPPLSRIQPPLLPGIEDEDEELTPTPSSTPTPTPKAALTLTRSSLGSGNEGDRNTLDGGSIASDPFPDPDSGSRIIPDSDFKEEIVFKETSTNHPRVTSQISLSSWSSAASVATRTNTDNPASMSHIVTNFNITRTAAAAVIHSSTSSSDTARRSSTSSKSQQKKLTALPMSAVQTTAVTEDESTKEYTPLRVFKQTPV